MDSIILDGKSALIVLRQELVYATTLPRPLPYPSISSWLPTWMASGTRCYTRSPTLWLDMNTVMMKSGRRRQSRSDVMESGVMRVSFTCPSGSSPAHVVETRSTGTTWSSTTSERSCVDSAMEASRPSTSRQGRPSICLHLLLTNL